MGDKAQESRAPRESELPGNSDPTGIGPPPPGAEAHVENGRGVTTAPPVGTDEERRKGSAEG